MNPVDDHCVPSANRVMCHSPVWINLVVFLPPDGNRGVRIVIFDLNYSLAAVSKINADKGFWVWIALLAPIFETVADEYTILDAKPLHV